MSADPILCWPVIRTRHMVLSEIAGVSKALLRFLDDRARVRDTPALNEWNEQNIARASRELRELHVELERV